MKKPLKMLVLGLLSTVAVLILALTLPLAEPPTATLSGPVALTGVTIIDVEQGEAVADQTVVSATGLSSMSRLAPGYRYLPTFVVWMRRGNT